MNYDNYVLPVPINEVNASEFTRKYTCTNK